MAAKMKKMDETSRVCGEMLDILQWNTEFVRGQSRDEGTIGFEERHLLSIGVIRSPETTK
jgi:hypothetical protein